MNGSGDTPPHFKTENSPRETEKRANGFAETEILRFLIFGFCKKRKEGRCNDKLH